MFGHVIFSQVVHITILNMNVDGLYEKIEDTEENKAKLELDLSILYTLRRFANELFTG